MKHIQQNTVTMKNNIQKLYNLQKEYRRNQLIIHYGIAVVFAGMLAQIVVMIKALV